MCTLDRERQAELRGLLQNARLALKKLRDGLDSAIVEYPDCVTAFHACAATLGYLEVVDEVLS